MKPLTRRTLLRVGIPGTIALVGSPPVAASLDGKGNDILTGIDDGATMVPSGRTVTVSGHITCDDNQENVEVSVEISQASTGAEAEGRFHARCTGDTQDWTVRATTRDGSAFEETSEANEDSTAEVHAFARTRKNGAQTDAHDWWNRSVSITKVHG